MVSRIFLSLLYCFCALSSNLSTNGDDSISVATDYLQNKLDKVNQSICMEEADKHFLRIMNEYSNNNERRRMEFWSYPFVTEILNDSEKYATFCNSIQNITVNYERCGFHQALETLKKFPHMFLCLNKKKILSHAECLTDASSQCVANCHQMFKNSSYPKTNCKKFSCFTSCVYKECKSLVLHYYLTHAYTNKDTNATNTLPTHYYKYQYSQYLITEEMIDDLECDHLRVIWEVLSEISLQTTMKNTISSEYESSCKECNCIHAWLAIAFTTMLTFVFAALYYMQLKKSHVYRRMRQLSADQIYIRNKLGSGPFGEVFKATVQYDGRYCCGTHTQTLAIKVLKLSASDRDKKAFLEEAILLSKLESEYIVRIMGICMDSRPIMLALEYCDGGSLVGYLKRDEDRQQITISDLYNISLDVLKGCHYLECKGIVHRDISARNCLVCQRINSVRPDVVKIADFGLAKVSNYCTDVMTFPIAHTAPEGFGGKFSSKSDVWSYGVLLWEIWTWGAFPFGPCAFHSGDDSSCPMVPFNTYEIRDFVCNTESPRSLVHWQRTPCGAIFSAGDDIQEIMTSCWAFQPNARPSFKDLLGYMKEAKSRILQKEMIRPHESNKSNQSVVEEEEQTSTNMKNESPHSLFSPYGNPSTERDVSMSEPTYSLIINPYGNPSTERDVSMSEPTYSLIINPYGNPSTERDVSMRRDVQEEEELSETNDIEKELLQENDKKTHDTNTYIR